MTTKVKEIRGTKSGIIELMSECFGDTVRYPILKRRLESYGFKYSERLILNYDLLMSSVFKSRMFGHAGMSETVYTGF